MKNKKNVIQEGQCRKSTVAKPVQSRALMQMSK